MVGSDCTPVGQREGVLKKTYRTGKTWLNKTGHQKEGSRIRSKRRPEKGEKKNIKEINNNQKKKTKKTKKTWTTGRGDVQLNLTRDKLHIHW